METAATISRTYSTPKKLTISREDLTGAFLKKIVNIPNLGFIPQGGEISLNLGKKKLDVPATYTIALEVASAAQLKSLEALHIASALTATRVYGEKIDYFVTLDEGTLKQGPALESMKIKVISPKTLLKETE